MGKGSLQLTKRLAMRAVRHSAEGVLQEPQAIKGISMQTRLRTGFLVSSILLGMLIHADLAQATHYWAATSGATAKDWFDVSNWKTNVYGVVTAPPGLNDVVTISFSGVQYNGIVSVPEDTTVLSLNFVQNSTSAIAIFDVRNGTEPKVLTSTGNIGFNGSNSRAAISNGTLRTMGQTLLGQYTGNNNNLLLVDAGGTFASSNNLVVSLNGQHDNQLVATNGGTIICGASIYSGNGAGYGNAVVISGPGSSATTKLHMIPGGSGSDSNTVVVRDGGVFNVGSVLYAGNGTVTDPSNWNCVTVDGEDSQIKANIGAIGFLGHSNRLEVLNGSCATFTSKLTVGQGIGNKGNGLVISNGATVVISGTEGLIVNPDSYVTCHVKNAVTGLDLGSTSSLSIADTGIIHFRFEFSPEGVSPFWGLRWGGSHTAALQALNASGKLTWEATVPGDVRIHYEAPYTYVSFKAHMGTVLLIR